MINNIYKLIMWIAVALGVGLITYAGIQMIINSATPGKSLAARGLILQTLGALAIVFGSTLIVNETFRALAGSQANPSGVFQSFTCTSTSPNLGGEGLKKVTGGKVVLEKANETGGSQNDKPTGASGVQSGTAAGPGSVIVGPAKLKVFKQGGNAPWAQQMYGSNTYANSGCGPDSFATALNALGVRKRDGGELNPKYVGDIFVNAGLRIPNQGTATGGAANLINTQQEKYFSGTKVKITPLGEGPAALSSAEKALKAGKIVVIAAGGPSIFTGGGHVTTLHGYNAANNTYGVYDSGYRDYYEVTRNQIIGGNPLYYIVDKK